MDCSSSYLHLEFTISILFIQSQRPYPSYGMPLCTVIPVFTVNVKVNPPFPLYFQAFSLFYHTFKVQIQILLLKTFFLFCLPYRSLKLFYVFYRYPCFICTIIRIGRFPEFFRIDQTDLQIFHFALRKRMYCRIGIQHAITQADLPSTFSRTFLRK